MTQRIRQNFDNIGLRPENFYDYLLHEVSFTIGETIAIPTHASQGFQRPLQVKSKTIMHVLTKPGSKTLKQESLMLMLTIFTRYLQNYHQ